MESLVLKGKMDSINTMRILFQDAIKERSSDIHIENFDGIISFKYRIDGELIIKNIENISFEDYLELISRIKILAKMDISEKRLPQDGRFNENINDEMYEYRVSSIPTINGESLVIRILNSNTRNLDLKHLGFLEKDLIILDRLIKHDSGIILVVGPTGSGKSTTLFSLIEKINTGNKKVISLEDPVEYKIKGLTQIQIKEELGFDFSKGLKFILRHDPDVIFLGEIRDKISAEIAIKSALTGHLMFSTLHTNSALKTIERLINMGIEKHLILETVKGIISQRLVKLVCIDCGGLGCEKCNQGYRGRTVVYEILEMNDEIKKALKTDNDNIFNLFETIEENKKMKKDLGLI